MTLRLPLFALSVWLLAAIWPACLLAQPLGGVAVEFQTVNARGEAATLQARLWKPETPSSAAVVLIHGSAGWTDHREGYHARSLAQAGFVTLAFDAFGSRGAASTVDDQARVSSLQMARDALAGAHYLARMGIPLSRQAVMGFSKGGAAALFSVDRTFLPVETERFAGAIAFYPACSTRARHPKPAAPIFFALAERDDYAGVQPCLDLAGDMRAAGGVAEVVVYPDAAHDFDGDPASSGMIWLRHAENYMDCRLLVEDDGSMTLGSRRFPAGDTGALAAMKSSCMRKGASVWTNLKQKEQATRDVIAFLLRLFGSPRS